MAANKREAVYVYPINVRLSEAQFESLQALAAVTGHSVTELIRQGVELRCEIQPED